LTNTIIISNLSRGWIELEPVAGINSLEARISDEGSDG
jgi:hypothetical protein